MKKKDSGDGAAGLGRKTTRILLKNFLKHPNYSNNNESKVKVLPNLTDLNKNQ